MTEAFAAETTIDRPIDEVWARLVDGRSVTVTSGQGGVTADYIYTCTSAGEGTRVSLVADCRMTGPVRLLGPVIRSAIRKADSGQLTAFAATVRAS